MDSGMAVFFRGTIIVVPRSSKVESLSVQLSGVEALYHPSELSIVFKF